jgi:hypothetical protein
MKIEPTSLKRHQSATAWAMNSGPLSKRTKAGAPRSTTRRSKVVTTHRHRWNARLRWRGIPG